MKNFLLVFVGLCFGLVIAGGMYYLMEVSKMDNNALESTRLQTKDFDEGSILGKIRNMEVGMSTQKEVGYVYELTQPKDDMPVIVFEGEGLFQGKEGARQREYLEEKFINPFLDYNKSDSNSKIRIVSIMISVPQNIGEKYIVRTVNSDGSSGGFLFGSRGQEYDIWIPGCFSECKFTDLYKQKYPEVVRLYKESNRP